MTLTEFVSLDVAHSARGRTFKLCVLTEPTFTGEILFGKIREPRFRLYEVTNLVENPAQFDGWTKGSVPDI